jgi:hypothetical protein
MWKVCASVQAIKYIHKYIYKGMDHSTVQLQSENDEISRHLQGRYIGPTEAIWCLMEFPTHEEYPPVMHLAIHLPGDQPVYFAADANLAELQQQMDNARSTLMAFFQYNTEYEDGQQYLYQEFPTYYIYKQKERTWHL